MRDITYCASNCFNTECMRHKSKANKYSSWADLSDDCDLYMKADKSLIFYDAVNNGTFSFSGNRNGCTWNKMKPLTKEQLIAFKDEIEDIMHD